MKFARYLPLMAGAFLAATGAMAAEGHLFSTEAEASQSCGADQVVWVDLDHGRLYQKGQTAYGKGANGGYGCMKELHAKYRPARTE
jgi:hypothetical protein